MAHASGFPLHGRTVFQGLRISIENRKGSWRVDKHHSPPRWRTKMMCDYGEVISSEGVDGDAVDCFLGPNPDAKYAFIVRQVNPRTGRFDEQKTMLGFDTISQAKQMYLRHYDSPDFFGGISAMPMSEFKRKVLNTLHGPKLIKSLAARLGAAKRNEDCPHCGASMERDSYTGKCNSCGEDWPLFKGMVAGHFLTTHGGKKVWVEPYEDQRVRAQRPAGEQKPRPGDSGLLFPDMGFVRPIPEKPKPKPAPPPVHQLSMFDMTEKSLDDEENGAPAFGWSARSDASPVWMNIARSSNPMPDDEPTFWFSPEDERAFKMGAFALALSKNPRPCEAVADAGRRLSQARLLANLCFGGMLGEANREPLFEAMSMEPVAFAFAMRRLKDELRASPTALPAPQNETARFAEIPL